MEKLSSQLLEKLTLSTVNVLYSGKLMINFYKFNLGNDDLQSIYFNVEYRKLQPLTVDKNHHENQHLSHMQSITLSKVNAFKLLKS